MTVTASTIFRRRGEGLDPDDPAVGAALRRLNEYVVQKPPTTARVYALDARKYSSPADKGVQVRQRVRETPETVTLVLTRDMLAEFANRFQRFAEAHQPKPPA